MEVKLFNFFYFFYLVLPIITTIIINIILKNKSQKFKFYFILVIAFTGFALHFLKQVFPPYNADFPSSLRKSSFENICAVSTLIFPFILLGKNTKYKDYMLVIGIISGILATLYPTEAFNRNPFMFDVMRYYYCHYVIFLVPYLVERNKIHTLTLDRVFNVGRVFIEVLMIIIVNEVVLIGVGFVDCTITDLLDSNYRNSSLIFGVPDSLSQFGFLLDGFVPNFMKYNIITHERQYWPLIWLIIPAYFYCTLVAVINCLIFNRCDTIYRFKVFLNKQLNMPLF